MLPQLFLNYKASFGLTLMESNIFNGSQLLYFIEGNVGIDFKQHFRFSKAIVF